LRETLLSIAGQTRSPDEVVIVNDASVDDTKQMADRLCKKYGLKYQIVNHNENQGIGASRQHGAFKAKGEFIAFLSSDDSYHPNFLEACLPHVDRDIATFTSYYRCNENLSIFDVYEPPWFDSQDGFKTMAIHWALQKNMFVNFSTIILPRRYFTKVEFKPELRHGEDLIFLLDSILAKQKWTCIRFPLLAYRLHGKQGTHLRDLDEWELLWRMLKQRLDKLGVPEWMVEAGYLQDKKTLFRYISPTRRVLRKIKSLIP